MHTSSTVFYILQSPTSNPIKNRKDGDKKKFQIPNNRALDDTVYQDFSKGCAKTF